jgi:hypothetical protein
MRSEASFLPFGGLARLPTSSSFQLPAGFGQSFALDDACMRTAAADLAFSFSHPAD